MQAKAKTNTSIDQQQKLEYIEKDLDLARDFFCIVKMVDILPQVKRHTDKQTRSLYQAISEGRDIQALENQLEAFFGKPQKPTGESLSGNLESHPAVNYLGSIQNEQALFLKNARTGAYYGVLEPDSASNHINIHLGFCHHQMSAEDQHKLEALIKTNMRLQALFDKLDARHKGEIQDIRFATFLQLAELLKLTCTLKVRTNKSTGYLSIYKGNVIAAEAGSLKNREAAYEIVSWKNTKLEIENASKQTENNIKQPLVDILKEGLKLSQRGVSENKEPQINTKKARPSAKKDPGIELREGKPSDQKEPGIEHRKSKHSAKKVSGIEGRKGKASAKKAPKLEHRKGKPSAKKEPPAESRPVAAPRQPPAERYAEQIKRSKKSKKRSVLPLAAIIGGVVIFLVVAGVTFYFLGSKSVKNEYQSLIVQLENQPDPEQQQLLLQKFINSHDQSEYTQDAAKRIEAISQRLEEQEYQQTIQKVEMLSLDENYQVQASALYSRFLEKYPSSPHADEIVEQLAEIPSRIDAADFEKLRSIEHLGGEQRIAAYAKYLADHPRGKYVGQVEQLISGMSEEYFTHLKQEMPVCEQQNNWDSCIRLSSQYLKYFENSSRSDEVIGLQKQFQDKKELTLLKARAEKEGDNFKAVKQIYLEYLGKNPDSSVRKKLENELATLEERLAAKQKWDAIAAYSQDEQIQISTRMYKLKRYIRKNSSGPYVEDAKLILGQLQSEIQARRQRQIELLEEQQQARLQQEKERKKREQERLQIERQRIQAEREKMIARLMPVNGRFIANGDGTVTDSKSGLMWTILDSYQELGNCVNYESALAYAENLETGGYQDWRLPIAGDLAGIYKKKPFSPDSVSAWYWTSKTAETGISNFAGFVTTKNENIFKRQYKKLDECGAVRAVRP